MQTRTITSAVIVALFLTASAAHAAVITFQDCDLDGAAARWRTTSVAKPLEHDGDNRYGTDGWAMWLGPGGMMENPADARLEDLPSYVSDFAETSGSYVYRGAYASIDDPTLPMPAEVVTGGLCTSPGPGIFTDQLSFTITSDHSFSFGVITDTSDSGVYIPTALKLSSSTSGFSCEIAVDTTQGYNLTPDFYAFNVADAVAGETFTLSASGGSSSYTNIAAVTWDLGTSAVGEATITFQGSDLDGAGARWRTTSVAKPLEHDGDNLYGSDGWVMWQGDYGMTSNPADARVSNLPSYVSDFSEGNACFAYHGEGYQIIDDPLAMPNTVTAGAVCSNPGEGVYADQISFTITSDCSISLGVMIDTSDDSIFTPTSLNLSSTSGRSCEVMVDITQGYNLTPDFYFFNIANAVAGETFTLSASGGSSGYTNIAAITWDLGTSEPIWAPGDANKDGKVDGSDVTILAGNWQVGVGGVGGVGGATWEMGDFNGDGKVDGSDVTILAGNWQAGVSTATASVPEPGTVVLLISAIVSLLIWRRAR